MPHHLFVALVAAAAVMAGLGAAQVKITSDIGDDLEIFTDNNGPINWRLTSSSEAEAFWNVGDELVENYVDSDIGAYYGFDLHLHFVSDDFETRSVRFTSAAQSIDADDANTVLLTPAAVRANGNICDDAAVVENLDVTGSGIPQWFVHGSPENGWAYDGHPLDSFSEDGVGGIAHCSEQNSFAADDISVQMRNSYYVSPDTWWLRHTTVWDLDVHNPDLEDVTFEWSTIVGCSEARDVGCPADSFTFNSFNPRQRLGLAQQDPLPLPFTASCFQDLAEFESFWNEGGDYDCDDSNDDGVGLSVMWTEMENPETLETEVVGYCQLFDQRHELTFDPITEDDGGLHYRYFAAYGNSDLATYRDGDRFAAAVFTVTGENIFDTLARCELLRAAINDIEPVGTLIYGRDWWPESSSTKRGVARREIPGAPSASAEAARSLKRQEELPPTPPLPNPWMMASETLRSYVINWSSETEVEALPTCCGLCGLADSCSLGCLESAEGCKPDYCLQCGQYDVDGCGYVRGDPHFVGSDSERYDVMGESGKSYIMLTDEDIHVNAEFQQGCRPLSTTMKRVGMVLPNGSKVLFEAYSEGYRLEVDGQQVSIGDTHKVAVGWVLSHRSADPASGRAKDHGDVLLVGDAYTVALSQHTASCGVGSVSMSVQFNKHVDRVPHGLLGQTHRLDGGKSRSHARNGRRYVQGEGNIEGTVANYEVDDVFTVEPKVVGLLSRFRGRTSA